MADRTSAGLFAEVFQILAASKVDPGVALKVWELTKHYDFHPCQMDCGDALEALGLARYVPPSPGTDDEEDIEYGPLGKREVAGT